ncbi:class II aldolase/adducin family protein [Acidocella sp.]|uniref:class II aldolase/adducin family protein n=1 Tax=Acidocella sp. TaxID=50710 RepID=UPI0026334A04|nr:class II aldolase/adducin family protein [Acidocella sp.]
MLSDRENLIAAARAMAARGLSIGTSGNVSLRGAEGILITPSAVPYEALTPEMIPLLRPDGSFEGRFRPSSEWRFHLDIYLSRPSAGGIVHHHAPYCTALSVARREIPACHYMITRFGGGSVRCADYALFGTEALSKAILNALEGRTACLMANHGGLALGRDVFAALGAATELEALAQQYMLSLQAGGPVLLSDQEIEDATNQFATAYRPNTGG